MSLAFSAFAQFEQDKFVITFQPNVDVTTEISNANAFLASINSAATIDPEYDATAGGLVFELQGDDPAALKALVETYFPADTNVSSIGYVPDDTNENEDQSDLNESTDSAEAGSDVVGFVKLATPAPKGGTKVMLASNKSKLAGVPAYVIVPAGKTSAKFKIHTSKTAPTSQVRIASFLNGRMFSMNLHIKKSTKRP